MASRGGEGLRRRPTSLVALSVIVLGVAACGSGSPSSVAQIATTVSSAAFATSTVSPRPESTTQPGQPALSVASPGPTTTATPSSSSPAASPGGDTADKYEAALAYVDCMRSHGVPNFPDPSAGGQVNVDFASGGKDGSPASAGIDRMSPQYISADQTCRHLLPGGVPTPAQNQQALAQELKFAQCMRSHGVPNFPDPTSAGVVHLIGVDQDSPQYQSAGKTCEALVPGVDSK
jgi:hypothetical protein